MAREIKDETHITVSRSFDGKHELQFNELTHRYKWLCKCHDKAAIPGVTTFSKAGYATSMGLITWMREETAKWLLEQVSVPGDGGLVPRKGFWPITDECRDQLFKTGKSIDRGTALEAADIGTICHAYAEMHSLGNLTGAADLLKEVRDVKAWPLIESCVNKYSEWAAQNKGELVMAEGIVASPKHFFGGKFDRLDRVDGKLILRDYKTSKDIYLENYIQLGAYAIAIKEWLGLDIGGYEVLRFGKEDGTFDHLLVDDPDELKIFQKQALTCYDTYQFRKLENDPRWSWKGAAK